MTGREPLRIGRLLKLGALVALFAAMVALGRSLMRAQSGSPSLDPARVKRAKVTQAIHGSTPTPPAKSEVKSALPELVTYAVGYGLALVLTIAAFAMVQWHWAPPTTTLAIVFGLALVQMIVHFRCFLHVSFREPARDDLQLILFSTAIILLMVGGTLVILFNLRMRMM